MQLKAPDSLPWFNPDILKYVFKEKHPLSVETSMHWPQADIWFTKEFSAKGRHGIPQDIPSLVETEPPFIKSATVDERKVDRQSVNLRSPTPRASSHCSVYFGAIPSGLACPSLQQGLGLVTGGRALALRVEHLTSTHRITTNTSVSHGHISCSVNTIWETFNIAPHF